MESVFKSGAVAALIAITACVAAPAAAGDLKGYRGSLKDGPPVHHYSAGPCYVRGDIGYSVSSDPDVRWPVTNERPAGSGIFVYDGDAVSNVDIENSWFGEVGIGCGSGSRGFRAEVAASFRGDKNIDGEPIVFAGAPDDPLHTSVSSYALMLNVYKDLGRWGRVVPYLGAGIGVSYNMVDEVYFTQNPALTNTIAGDRDIAFAWSLMAGFGYQISQRAILDFGYRYIDLGSGKSGRVDSAGFANPAVEIDDLTAHEFKVGLRYHFGTSAPAHRSFK